MSLGKGPKGTPPDETREAASAAKRAKSSVFWGSALAPTESKAEFDKYHKQLQAERQPEGMEQEECVLRIAELRWRLNHLGLFLEAEKCRFPYQAFVGEPTLWMAMAKYSRFIFSEVEREFKLQEDEAEEQKELGEKAKLGSACDASQTSAEKGESPAGKTAERMSLHEIVVGLTQKRVEVEQEVRMLLGSEIGDSTDRVEREAATLELAYYADLFTADNFLEKLRVVNAIECAIDRNLVRLRQLKKEARKDAERLNNRSGLLPPYRRR
jgi:hypothetical protein